MEENNKYARGKIYTIRSPLTDKVYVGSTVNKLSKRFSDHKSGYKRYRKGTGKYTAAYDIFDIDDKGTYIELYEFYPCNDKHELNKREGEVTRMTKNFVNKNIPGRTMDDWKLDNPDYNKQWRQNNPEYYRQYRQNNRQRCYERSRQWHQNNKQKLNEKHECPCGGRYTYKNRAMHMKNKKHNTWVFNEWQELNHF